MSKKNRNRLGKGPGQKPVHAPPRKSDLRAQYEQCYSVAKKIMLHFELKPELIDVFTKKQRQILLMLCYDPPLIKAKKDRTVPRQYVRNISNDTYQFMKTHFWGKPEHGVTYMELATYGFSFLGNLHDYLEKESFAAGTPQEEAATLIIEKLGNHVFFERAMEEVLDQIWYMTRGYSRVSYRMYGFEFEVDRTEKPRGFCYFNRLLILITAQESETKIFTFNRIERMAYRLFMTSDALHKPSPATISSKKIFPKAQDDVQLNFYIQSHVLHRFKQRMDSFEPFFQNLLIQYAFTLGLRLVRFEDQVLFACLTEEERTVGYFTFFVQAGDIVINTFLPLVSPNTPEGKKLHEQLSLSKDEIAYLGMDKISFLQKIDFEQIPVLKQALIDADIWATKLVLDDNEQEESLIDPDKTMFVKKFLDKKEEYKC